MKRGFLAAAALVAAAFSGAATAETLVVGDTVAVRESSVPHPNRGMTMSAVEARFGQPATRHNAVGEPPITRWDYPGFSVYFEHQFVIHAVVSGS
ncbi:MAG TPA: hypothetical protein VEZ88_04075 [Steroidobacteraceae bacterium]|nr:hypothetical protein [Steroidobacteraceae bacterium]